MIRSGLCHGPDCQQKITEKSPSQDFCSDGCQARWSAAAVGTKPDPSFARRPARGFFGAAIEREMPELERRVGEALEALRPSTTPTLPWGLREGDLVALGDDPRLFRVTEPEPGRAVLNPIEDRPKPLRRVWWKPNTWRRS